MKLGTETLARSAARRPWVTVGIWVAVLVASFFLMSTFLGKGLTNDIKITNNPESKQADTLLAQRLSRPDKSDQEMVIVRSATLTVDDPAYQSYVEGLFGSMMDLGNTVVKGGVNYYMTGDKSLVSADRHTTLIPLAMPDGSEKVVDRLYQIADQSSKDSQFEVFFTGDASFNADTAKLAEGTLKTGETVGISVALVVLALVFGAIAAALLPVVLGVVAVIGALGLTSLVAQTMQLSTFVTNMITMIGLAVGIDYSLFIVTRFREERKRGLAKVDAIAAAGATASRAVLFSGMTVVLALVGMVIFPLSIFQSMGIGAILVVFTALLATLTLLPAMLSLLGDKVNAIRIPLLQRRKQTLPGESQSGFWARTTRLVTARPVLSIVVAGGLLAAVAIPYFDKHAGMSGISGIPDNLRAKQGFNVLQKEFGLGMDAPAIIVIDAPTDSESVRASIAHLQATVASDPAFVGSELQTYPQADLSVLRARLAGDPMSRQAMDAVERLRAKYVHDSFGGSPARVTVTGQTAGVLDFDSTTDAYTPVVFGFVLSLSFVLLMVAFRSVVVPATAIMMNLLSVGAVYGLIVLVFQKGVGAHLFGFQQVDVIESWLPLFLFAVLFGLSMDYHVFLLSRIRERFKQTGDNAEAVSFGLRSTGGIITGAALIMVAVFGGFALGDMVMFQQMGFGLAMAVLLDATIVRSVLVPATMKLLGKRNWYFPAWLARIPNVSVGEGIQAAARPLRALADKASLPGQQVPVAVPVPVEELEMASEQNDPQRES